MCVHIDVSNPNPWPPVLSQPYLHGERNGNLLQYSCLESPVDRGVWWAALHGVAESDMTEAT